MRWYTCTPVAFGGGPDFFARDSGLLCRGFREIGVESMAVMPGEKKPEDEPELIRTDYRNLESTEWWREHQLDGVVLYAWGSPRYRFVAKAIHDAGIKLVLNQDHGGLVSPLAGLSGWLQDQWNLAGGFMRFMAQVLKGVSYGLFFTDPRRAQHLSHGDVIACVSPQAAQAYAKFCRWYGGNTMVERIQVIPHSVDHRFIYADSPKSRQLVCVGRWNDEVQKRPWLLMRVLDRLLREDAQVTVVIVGETSVAMQAWHHRLAKEQQDRVSLLGRMLPDALIALYQQSQVFYSPSAYESFGIAAAESLCSGCSVVATGSVSMSAFSWFVSEKSGTLAKGDGVHHHVAAIQEELSQWRRGARDANQISSVWRDRLHAARVAEKVLGAFSETR